MLRVNVVAVKIAKEAAAVHEVTVHVVEAHQLIPHYDAIIRDQDHVPGLVRTTSVYVYVSHDTIIEN